MRLKRAKGRETGHFQIKARRVSHRKPFQFSKEHDFIALAAPGKTLVMPETVLAPEH